MAIEALRACVCVPGGRRHSFPGNGIIDVRTGGRNSKKVAYDVRIRTIEAISFLSFDG